jgi:hypothetical protein
VKIANGQLIFSDLQYKPVALDATSCERQTEPRCNFSGPNIRLGLDRLDNSLVHNDVALVAL